MGIGDVLASLVRRLGRSASPGRSDPLTVDDLPECRSAEECAEHDGQRVAVVGTYTVWDPLPMRKRDHPPARQVRLDVEGGDGPFLGAWDTEEHQRPLDEIDRLAGRLVRVVGTFHLQMPKFDSADPRATSLGGSCLDGITGLDDLEGGPGR